MKKVLFMLLLAITLSFSFCLNRAVTVDASTNNDAIIIETTEDDGEDNQGLTNNDNEDSAVPCSVPVVSNGENHDGVGNPGVLGGGNNEGNASICDYPPVLDGEDHDGNPNPGVLGGGNNEGDASTCDYPPVLGGEDHDGNPNPGVLGGEIEVDESVE